MTVGIVNLFKAVYVQALLACRPDALIGLLPQDLAAIHPQLGTVVTQHLASPTPQNGKTWPFEQGACTCYTLSYHASPHNEGGVTNRSTMRFHGHKER